MDVCLNAYLQHLLLTSCGLHLDGKPGTIMPKVGEGAGGAVGCLYQLSLIKYIFFSDVYRCTEKEAYLRNRSKECHPKRNANQMLMQVSLSIFFKDTLK